MTIDPTLPHNATVHISCLLDNAPRFRMQVWNWFLSLKALNTRCSIFVHHTSGALSPDLAASLLADGVTLVEVAPFGDDSARYCNKVRQLETEALLDADFVVLADADLLFLDDPFNLTAADTFRAKSVDLDNPPRDLWLSLFERAGMAHVLEEIGTVPVEFTPSSTTFSTNFNGGLYVMPGAVARRLAPKWNRFARFCLSQPDLLGDFLHHADQLGMGLALAEEQVPISRLPAGANLPTHLPATMLGQLTLQPISALHYHSNIDTHGMPLPTGVAWIDREIYYSRLLLSTWRRHDFLEKVSSDFRHQHSQQFGFEPGARAAVLLVKQSLLSPYLAAIGKGSVLDVGCTDLEVFAPVSGLEWTGLVISEHVLRFARAKQPGWTFRKGDIADVQGAGFDYCFCIDVLIHQHSEVAAATLFNHLLRVARKGLVIGVQSESDSGAGVFSCTSGLKAVMDSHPLVTSIHEIGRYCDVTLYLVEKNFGERLTPHDIGLGEQVIGGRLALDDQALKHLVAYSRQKIGFFPRTVIRSHEYPWFAERMQACAGQRVLDVGAGVSLLPFLLADRGASVTTVDQHPIIRNLQPRSDWNEWGYLDYGALDPRIRSFQVDACSFEPDESYMWIYSVSVIEHMPAYRRRVLLSHLPEILEPGGQLLLSVDLVPGTEMLWNFSEGVLVDAEEHGTLEDLRQEISGAGLTLCHEEQVRDIALSRTDVAYLVYTKKITQSR